MNQLPITINLDSTSLGSSGCILDLVRTLIGDVSTPELGAYRERTLGPSLVYGIAVHKFIDTMYKTGGNFPLARDAAKKSFAIPCHSDDKKKWLRDEKHMINVCYLVWEMYIVPDASFDVLSIPLGDSKVGPAVEINFSIPYYKDDAIDVNLCGTIDRVGKYKNGCYAIRDWKTTSSWNTEEYFEEYELSRQLRFYNLACKLMAEKHPDSILGTIGATKIGAAIDGIFLSANSNDTTFKMSTVFQFSDMAIERFKATLDTKIQELSRAVKIGFFPKEGILNGHCSRPWGENKIGKCKFWHACKNDDSVAEVLLKRDFTRKIYNPLSFNE